MSNIFEFQISEGNISKDMVTELVRPFVIHLASTDDQRQIKHIIKNIFRYLVLQSDVGMDYTEKFNAWRNVSISFLLKYCCVRMNPIFSK